MTVTSKNIEELEALKELIEKISETDEVNSS